MRSIVINVLVGLLTVPAFAQRRTRRTGAIAADKRRRPSWVTWRKERVGKWSRRATMRFRACSRSSAMSRTTSSTTGIS